MSLLITILIPWYNNLTTLTNNRKRRYLNGRVCSYFIVIRRSRTRVNNAMRPLDSRIALKFICA